MTITAAGRRRLYLVGFTVLMLFDTLGHVSFKLAGAHALPLEPGLGWLLRVFGQPWIYGGLVGYLGTFVTWMALLEHAPIGPAFAASHLEILPVLAVSAWGFGEHLGPNQLAGAALIVAGIVVLAISETRDPPPQPQPQLPEAAAD